VEECNDKNVHIITLKEQRKREHCSISNVGTRNSKSVAVFKALTNLYQSIEQRNFVSNYPKIYQVRILDLISVFVR
jgi:hypothetical protein